MYDVNEERVVDMVQMIPTDELLMEEINIKKVELIQYASKFQLTDNRVVKCSQELDKLLNQYQSFENTALGTNHNHQIKLVERGSNNGNPYNDIRSRK